MDRFPLYLDGETAGELTVTQEPPYLQFEAICRTDRRDILRAYAVGETGEIRLGVLEPISGKLLIRRRLSVREASPAGRILRGEARLLMPEEKKDVPWQSVVAPEYLFHSSFLREQLRGVPGVLTRQEGGFRYLALPFDRRRPFLLTSLFCFARILWIGGAEYAVFAFDQGENPVFR